MASPLELALGMEGAGGTLADLARSVYQQESGSGRNTQTSNAGAVGGMQITPRTFSGVADPGWDIADPVYNARAGVRYLKESLDAAKGDPSLAAVRYYGGPGGMAKARQGVAVSDPRNPNAPNTFQYAKQVVSRMANPNNLGALSQVGLPMDSPEAQSLLAESDRQRAPRASALDFAVPNPAIADEPAGALAQPSRNPNMDMRALMEQFIPQDDSRSKYLALAAGLVAPNKSGSFGESIGNVAGALQQERMNQEKLRSQYVPIIMQQVAAQQAREEQANYRMEAAQAAQQAAALKAEQDRVSREQIARERISQATEAAQLRSEDAKNRLAMLGAIKGMGTNVPKLKPGEKWNEDTQTIEPIVGSDLYRKQSDMHAKDANVLQGVNLKADKTKEVIAEILDPKNEDAFNSNFGGYNAAYATQYFPGATADMRKKIEGLKSNIKSAGLELMRMGGSIGALTEKEWPILEGMVARIDPMLGETAAREELAKVAAFMDRIKQNAANTYAGEWSNSVFGRKAASGSAAPPATAPTAPAQQNAAPKTVNFGDLK